MAFQQFTFEMDCESVDVVVQTTPSIQYLSFSLHDYHMIAIRNRE